MVSFGRKLIWIQSLPPIAVVAAAHSGPAVQALVANRVPFPVHRHGLGVWEVWAEFKTYLGLFFPSPLCSEIAT